VSLQNKTIITDPKLLKCIRFMKLNIISTINSIQIYLYSASFHNTYCFKAALQKVHFRNVHGKIHFFI